MGRRGRLYAEKRKKGGKGMKKEKDNVLLVCRKDDQNAIRKFVNDVEMRFGEKYS